MNSRPHCLRLLLLICLPAVLFAAPIPASAQVRVGHELTRLDPKVLVHDIAINGSVATTITFPEQITLLTGFGLITDPGQINQLTTAKVSIVHYENVIGDTLVVRLIKPGEPCHATIRTTRSIYLMRFSPADEANLAVIVSPPAQSTPVGEISADKVTEARIQFNSEELVGMLSKARNRKVLQPLNPALYNGWLERNGIEMTSEQKSVITSIYEIQRNPAKDLTVFRCWLTNTGATSFDFEPVGTKIRVGGRSYDTQLVDCANSVAPGQRVAMDIILQGGPGGSREGLSIQQDFRVELPEPGRYSNPLLPSLAGDSFADGK